MGNNVVKDFQQVSLGHGTMPNIDDIEQKSWIAHGSTILNRPATILVRRDYQRQSTIYFDQSTMTPIYVSHQKYRHGHEITITKDPHGRPLFLTTTMSSCPTSSRGVRAPKATARSTPCTKQWKRKLIFRAPPDVRYAASHKKVRRYSANLSATTTLAKERSSSDDTEASSTADLTSSSESYSCFRHGIDTTSQDVACAAQIDLDRSGAAICAFLSVVVWKGQGPELLCVYKAVKIPQVKYGALVMDMMGNVVGKTLIDEQRMLPIIQVAAGADLSSVIALASALLGDF